MTVSTTIVKNSYNGDSTTATFNFTFKVLAASELKVIIRSANATETTKLLNTHYSISGIGNANGGSVSFVAGSIPSSTEQVVLIRETAKTQNIDYLSNDPFPAETHEEGLDRGIMISQELVEEIGRSLKLSKTNTMNSTEFSIGAADRAGKILGFDNNGELVVSQELGSYAGTWGAATTYSARDIVKDSSNNNIYLCNTGHTSSGTVPISSNADSSKWDLLVDAQSATISQSAAAASAAAASSSAANALTYQNAALAAQLAAENIYDLFDDRFLGAKSVEPTLDNDGNALQDGVFFWDTSINVLKVYDLGNTAWRRTTPTTTEQTAINNVSSISAKVTTVADNITKVNQVYTDILKVVEVANDLQEATSEIDTVANSINNVDLVGTNIVAVNAVYTNIANINSVNTNAPNINSAVANANNINLVSGSIGNVNIVGNNINSVNAFAEKYRVSGTQPTTSLDIGDLWYDSTNQKLSIYTNSGWQTASDYVSALINRYHYTATNGQAVFTGADDFNLSLSFTTEANAFVFLNGIRIIKDQDYTLTNGNTLTLSVAANAGDLIYIEVVAKISITEEVTLQNYVSTALSYRNDAQTAKTAAETAQTASETAKSASEAARDLALQYRDTASSQATTATTQAGIATTQAGISTTKAAESLASANAAAVSALAAAAAAGGGAVAVTSSDTTADVLNNKIVVSGQLTKTILNSGGNEQIELGVVVVFNETNFTATNGQTTFSIAYTVGYIQCFVNGIKLINGQDFTATDGTSVVLNDACVAGDIVEFVKFK